MVLKLEDEEEFH